MIRIRVSVLRISQCTQAGTFIEQLFTFNKKNVWGEPLKRKNLYSCYSDDLSCTILFTTLGNKPQCVWSIMAGYVNSCYWCV